MMKPTLPQMLTAGQIAAPPYPAWDIAMRNASTANAPTNAAALTRLRKQQRLLLDAIRTHLAVSGSDQLHTRANQHDATDDDAVADTLAEMDLATLTTELNALRAIQLARKRIADGSFGICVDCGNRIATARLEAFPAAERCIPCQEGSESARGTVRHTL